MKKIVTVVFAMSLLLILSCSSPEPESTGQVVPGIPAKNTVTLVDLGATTCVPCKMMEPILAELKGQYKGRADIIFIDIWDEANKGKAKAFKVMGIPTQVFYDKKGNEVYRHMGFLDKESIVKELESLLAQ